VRRIRWTIAIDVAIEATQAIKLLPAGHVLGSAMITVDPAGRNAALHTGDFKLRESLTVGRRKSSGRINLVMESTYGLPISSSRRRNWSHEQLIDLVRTGDWCDGRQPIVMGLFARQEPVRIARILHDAGINVTMHVRRARDDTLYEELESSLDRFAATSYADFHGEAAIDLRERGVLLARRMSRARRSSRASTSLPHHHDRLGHAEETRSIAAVSITRCRFRITRISTSCS
jgi:Cft2 family RNA processing exonuclease